MTWYWFTATKNGQIVRERIPAETKGQALAELNKMGYSDVNIFRGVDSFGSAPRQAQTVQAAGYRCVRTCHNVAGVQAESRRIMREGEFYPVHNTQQWEGFTLQRGHLYGIIAGVRYVSSGEPSTQKPNCIMVYQQYFTRDCVKWRKMAIQADSDVGRAVLQAAQLNPFKCVTFPIERVKTQGSRPQFATFNESRPDASPRPPVTVARRSWVDEILHNARKGEVTV